MVCCRIRGMAAAAIGSVAGTVFAQSAPTEPPRQWGIDEITVTGRQQSFATGGVTTTTRTPTSILEVPQSVQTLTRTLLEEQDLQTVSDALVNVSGVTPSRTMEMVLQSPLIRGFPVNYYFDGLPTYALPSAAADPATLINVARVDVAKGPTSTLYGGGTGAPLSGLLNIVSLDPEAERSAGLDIRAGSFGTTGLQGDVNVPFGDSGIRFRLNGMYEEADSFIHVVDSERYALFPTLTWDASEDTRLTVRAQTTKLEQREYSGLPAELTIAPALVIDRNAFGGAEDAPRTVVDNDMLTLSLDHRFASDWQGSFAVRRYQGHFEEYSTYPLLQVAATAYAFGSGQVPSDVRKTFATAAFSRSFGSDRIEHRLLLGADYDSTDYFGGMGLDFAWGLIDYAAPATNAPFGAIPALSDLQNDELSTVAAFVQDQIGIGDRFDLTLGVRFTQLDVRSVYTSFGVPYADTDESYDEWTPRVGATYALTDSVSLFGGYARGFQGVVAAFGLPDPKPEESAAYEAGVKFFAPARGFSGTVALFDVTRQNVTTADPVNFGFSIQAGEQQARGLELDLIYEPSPAWSMLVSYADTDAKVTRDNTIPVGDKLRRVPERTGRVAVRYRFQNEAVRGLEIGGGVTSVSSRELTLPNTVAVDGLELVDAQLSYERARIGVALSIVNLLDEDGFEPYQYFGGAFVIPTTPRSAFLTLRVKL